MNLLRILRAVAGKQLLKSVLLASVITVATACNPTNYTDNCWFLCRWLTIISRNLFSPYYGKPHLYWLGLHFMNEKYVVTWDMLQIHARKLAQRLLPAEQWKGIIAVSRGGLVPAGILARELGIRYVDTVCISSYDHDNQRDLKVLKRAEGDGEGFIVIDDLVDTGGTATAIREMYPKAHL